MGKEPPSPRAEFLIAIAGPLVSLILGAGCLGGAMAVESLFAQSGFQGLIVLGSLLGMVNVQLGLFNLIPGFPLDGGRVLRAGLWARNKDFNRATSQAALVGIGFGVALGLIGAVLMVGALVRRSGTFHRDERGLAHLYRRIPLFGGLGKQTAGSPADFVGVGDGSSGHGPPRRDPATGYERAGRGRSILCRAWIWWIPSMRGWTGSRGGHSARRASASTALWPWRRVREIMCPASSAFCIPPDWSVMQAMERMVQGGWDRLVVMENEKIVGLVTRSAIAHFLQLHGA